MTDPARVLSVGQCGFDHRSISQSFRKAFDAEVESASTHAEALEALRAKPYDLVLVNRVGDRDGAKGIDLIQALKAEADLAGVPVMLVSDYPDAQREAVELGALPGFGKSDLGSLAASEDLRRIFENGG
jgi:two-component system chemotaxis response regulator CheY